MSKRMDILTDDDYCIKDMAIRLLELGFPCHTPYIKTDKLEIIQRISLYEAQKWFRDEHNLHITIFSSSQESWMYRITKPHQALEDGIYGEDYISYEDALCCALMKLIFSLQNIK